MQPVTEESVAGDDKPEATESGEGERGEQAVGCLFASIWAMLLARIYEIKPLACSRCGGEMRIIVLMYREVLMPREAGCRERRLPIRNPLGKSCGISGSGI
ncbi:MAG: hypothetical protein ABW166_20940 [Sedimenticola sp.]